MTSERTGFIPEADYQDPGLEDYRSNPLICCLPPIYSQSEVVSHLRVKPYFDNNERNLDGRLRAHAIARLLNSFFQPMTRHLQLEEKISLMIRQGYLGRNPASGDFYTHLQNGFERVKTEDLSACVFNTAVSTATGMSLFGASGCGKSKTLERIMSMYDQAVFHPESNITQLTYLKIDCPIDGDLDALCISFFSEVDRVLGTTSYYDSHGRKKLGTNRLMTSMCQVANLHALGILIIDEIQNLDEAKSGGAEKMHNFFVKLENTIGVPVIQVGTLKARTFFERTFRGARRITGMGSLLWDRLPSDAYWQKLMQQLWKYQWLRRAEPLSEELIKTMYDRTQGVMDIVVKLFVLGQMRAIVTGEERITPALLKQVYDDEFKPVHPMLEALRSNKADLISEYADMVMPEIELRMLTMTKAVENVDAKEGHSSPPINDDKGKKLLKLLLQVGMASDIAHPMVDRLLRSHPDMPLMALINKASEYAVEPKNEKDKGLKLSRVKRSEWGTLPGDDLRYLYTSKGDRDMYSTMLDSGAIFDLKGLINKAG